jgi:hypothetical protein
VKPTEETILYHGSSPFLRTKEKGKFHPLTNLGWISEWLKNALGCLFKKITNLGQKSLFNPDISQNSVAHEVYLMLKRPQQEAIDR